MQRAFGLEVPQTLGEASAPSRMALVVYDMQVGILRQIATAEAVTSRVLDVLGAAREAGVRVFFIRYMSLPKELMGVFQLRQAMSWQQVDRVEEVEPAFPRDSAQFQIVPELSALPSEAMIDRITMSAFSGTFLNLALRDCGIDAFAICGIAMEVGIEPTVRHATDLGYIPVIVQDACGAGHETAGRRSLESLKFAGDSLITDVVTISALFRKART